MFPAGRREVVAGDCVHGEHRGDHGGDEEDAHTRPLTLHICPGDYHDFDDDVDDDDDIGSDSGDVGNATGVMWRRLILAHAIYIIALFEYYDEDCEPIDQ